MVRRTLKGVSQRGAALLCLLSLVGLTGGCKTASTAEYKKYAKVDLSEHLKKVGLGPGDVLSFACTGRRNLQELTEFRPKVTWMCP